MKKLIALLLAVIMVFGLVACAAKEAPAAEKKEEPKAETKEEKKEETKEEKKEETKEEAPAEPEFAGTIKIGCVGPLTGASAETGIVAKEGQELAIAEWNANGGVVIDGQHYEVVMLYEDSAGDPATAVSAATKLLDSDKVDLLVGETLISGCILAVMDLAQNYPDVLFTTIEGVSTGIRDKVVANPDAYKNFWKPEWCSDAYGSNIAQSVEYLYQQGVITGDKTVAYVLEDTDYGRSNASAAEEVFKTFGWETIAFEVSPQGNTDFYSQIYKIQALEPTVVVSCFVPVASGIAYIKQVNEIGVEWTDVAIVYPSKPGFFEDTGNASVNLFWTPINFNPADPKVIELGEKLGKTVITDHISGYDTMNMLLTAVQESGTTKASQGLAEYYGAMNYQGILGVYAFDEGHCAKAGEGFLVQGTAQTQADFTNPIVWPESMKETDPVAQR